MSMSGDVVRITEVGPRDGLQNEAVLVPARRKIELIERLVAAGLREIEVSSFVSPDWIPQLADADEVVAALPRRAGVRYGALVPNEKGYERFRASGRLDVAALFISTSETHNRKNVNRGVDDHLERLRPVAERAHADGVSVRAYASTVFGCPYEGAIDPEAVVSLARRLDEIGADEIALGDTNGVGVPAQVRDLVARLEDHLALDRIVLHVHDTWGRGLANVAAGFDAGLRRFDASIGGLGGCPYAPGAAGNVATEDLVGFFDAAGVTTGIDLDALVDTSAWLEAHVLDRAIGSRVYRASLGARERANARLETGAGE